MSPRLVTDEEATREAPLVKIVRFDDEVSAPLDAAQGSLGKAALLVRATGPMSVNVIHLPSDGGLGRQAAETQRLLAVLAGQGWVSGTDDSRRPIRAGYGALFGAGEVHAVGSALGLTALCVEGSFESQAFAVTQLIEVLDADPDWPAWFEVVRARLWPFVADLAHRIDHVGSTSVPRLAAKPIIDMDVVVPSEDEVAPVIERLSSIGYRWLGDLGVEGRQAFAPPEDQTVPRHHLYLVVENNKAHVDHWLFRDVLRADPQLRERYAELKRRNQELADGDMDVYVAAKAAFVADVLRGARQERGLPAADYWHPDIETGSA